MIDATTRAQRCVLLEIPASQAGKSEGLGKRVSGGTNRQQGREALAAAGETCCCHAATGLMWMLAQGKETVAAWSCAGEASLEQEPARAGPRAREIWQN